jgi:hypothetical protein
MDIHQESILPTTLDCDGVFTFISVTRAAYNTLNN